MDQLTAERFDTPDFGAVSTELNELGTIGPEEISRMLGACGLKSASNPDTPPEGPFSNF